MSLFDGMDRVFVETLGEDDPFILRRPGAEDVSFRGIFTARYVPADGGLYSDVDSASAAVDAAAADLGPVEVCDGALIERTRTGETFRMRSVQPDAEGMVKIVLVRDCAP